jgi:hypothetical protein
MEVPMRKLAIAILAAAGVALSLPANAEGLWIGAGPVGVGIGAYPTFYDGPYAARVRYYDDSDYVYSTDYARCRTITQDFGARVRTVRQCY